MSLWVTPLVFSLGPLFGAGQSLDAARRQREEAAMWWYQRRRGLCVLVLTGALGVMGCAALFGNMPRLSLGHGAAGRVPIAADDVVIGEPEAPLTFVAFLNYEQSSSARVLAALEEARRRLPGSVRYVIKHATACSYASSDEAALMAEAVLASEGPQAYLQFQRDLLDHTARVGPEFIRHAARVAGLDDTELAGLDKKHLRQRVDRDLELLEELGSSWGVLTLLNGVRIVGAPSQKKLDELIARELPQAEALRARGASSREVYEARVAENVATWEPPKEKPAQVEPVSIALGNSPIQGPEAAPVTIVQFASLGSPCSKDLQPKLRHLRDKYPGRVRIVWKHLTWYSRALANFAEHAHKLGGHEKFFAAAELLWSSGPPLPLGKLENLAVQLGLDPQEVLRVIDEDRYGDTLDRNDALASELDVSEPTLFINGQRVTESDVEKLETLEQLVDRELTKPSAPTALAAVAATAKKTLVAPPDLPFRGAADAPVTVHVFASYRYAACVVPESLDRLFIEYPGRIKLVFWPLFPEDSEASSTVDQRATEAALEAHAQHGAAGFWHAAKLMCRYKFFYDDADREAYETDELHVLKWRINLDVERVHAALSDRRHLALVNAARAVAKEWDIDRITYVVDGAKFTRGTSVRRHVQERLAALEAAARPAQPVAASEEAAGSAAPAAETGSQP